MAIKAETDSRVRERGEVEQQGAFVYQTVVKPQIEPKRNGEFVALDVDSGDYSVDPDELLALRRLRQLRPKARVYFARVGATAVYDMRLTSDSGRG